MSQSAVANPKPETQSGGINAVAIATPGIAMVLFNLEPETIPATPPKNATPISSNVGLVRARISCVGSPSGVIKK